MSKKSIILCAYYCYVFSYEYGFQYFQFFCLFSLAGEDEGLLVGF